MEIEIKGIEGDRKAIEKIFLEIYANPLNNYKKNILRLDT
jgi:hypothetical protein